MISASEHSLTAPFLTQDGTPVPTCPWHTWHAIKADLVQYGLSSLQMAEACGFSSAMVVRFALGLSSLGGVVTVLASDSFYGWVSLACARHLLNGGSSVRIVMIPSGEQGTSPVSALLPIAARLGADIHYWNDPRDVNHVLQIVESSHNVLCGLSDAGASSRAWSRSVIECMNESAVPAHAIGTPVGISPDKRIIEDEALYASSTLSLGLPLEALNHNSDLVGRHYLCDMSWGRQQYLQVGLNGAPLFAEQPVIRLVPSL